MTDSPPSRLNRFWPTYFVCRKVSNASAALSRPSTCFCFSRSGCACLTSIRCWSHSRSSGSVMCMYSTPTVRQ